MSFPEFVLALAETLVWPATVIWLTYLLREPLSQLLPNLQTLEYKDKTVRVEFGEGIGSAQKHDGAIAAERESGDEPQASPSPSPELEELVDVDPHAAIVRAWSEVELAAVDLLRRRGIGFDYEDRRRFKSYQTALEQVGVLSGHVLGLYHDLRNLRNKVVHARNFEVTPSEATDYVELAVNLVHYLEHQSE